MKRLGILLATTCIPILALTRSDIDGYWSSNKHNITIYVEETFDGVKVQRTDQQEWYYYQKSGQDEFRDNLGNTYRLVDFNTLVWRASRKGKTISFSKSDTDRYGQRSGAHYGDRSRQRDYGYDDYDSRYDYRKGNRNNDVRPRRLEGRWINQSSGQRILIKTHRRGIKVKAFRRGDWTYFEQRRGGQFIDRRGNAYSFSNRGRLVYQSYSGDFMMRFQRSG